MSTDPVEPDPAGDVREALLAAARELFAAHGYERTTTRQIAARANTTSTSLFRHFGSKAALYARCSDADRADVPDVPDAPGAPAKRRYRPEAETRALLIAAATELFSAQGYTETSTSQIAERAGVPEIALFRYFETKANLFRIAIFDPLGALIRRYAEQWNDLAAPGLSLLAGDEFIDAFYHSMIEHRGALITLFTTRLRETADTESAREQQAAMSEILDPLTQAIQREITPEQHPGVDVAVATRLTIAMIGGTVFFKDWLFPSDEDISDGQIIAEMRAYVSAAFTGR
ncbi:MAG: TetR/AcrR family transcriptional regulator [Solirubrobacteraceae bacterium]